KARPVAWACMVFHEFESWRTDGILMSECKRTSALAGYQLPTCPTSANMYNFTNVCDMSLFDYRVSTSLKQSNSTPGVHIFDRRGGGAAHGLQHIQASASCRTVSISVSIM